MRKSKKEKREAAALAAGLVAIAVEEKASVSIDDIQTALPKSKNKSEKSSQINQLNKQPTTEPLKSNDDNSKRNDDVVPMQPVAETAAPVKPKKNKRKDKKSSPKDETKCSDNVPDKQQSPAIVSQKSAVEAKEKKLKASNIKKNNHLLLQQQQHEKTADKDNSQCCKTVSVSSVGVEQSIGGDIDTIVNFAKPSSKLDSV